VLGYDPLEAGVAYLPYGAGILAGMWLSSHAVIGLGMRRALVMSFLISSAGLLLLSGVAPNDGYASGVLPGMLVTSLGCGLSLPALTVAAVTGTTEENAGLGSAVLSSVQQVGGAVGLAVLVALATRRSDALADSEGALLAATEGFSFALTIASALLALGSLLIATLLGSRRSVGDSRPQVMPDTLYTVVTPTPWTSDAAPQLQEPSVEQQEPEVFWSVMASSSGVCAWAFRERLDASPSHAGQKYTPWGYCCRVWCAAHADGHAGVNLAVIRAVQRFRGAD
jgi:MFS family permease